MKRYFIAADQGTTSSRAVLFDEKFNVVDIVQNEFTQYYPKEGYVEHDPMEIYSSQYSAITSVIIQNRIESNSIYALGITNQRETTLVWDRETGVPVYNAIVWQCRRTASICEELIKKGYKDYIRKTTGLVIDAYFSATKIKWILDNVKGAKEKAKEGKLLFGTVDSWLVYNMSDKKVHVTDYTNASRTMIFDINNLCWDKKLCDELEIPISMLPEVKSSSEVYGYAHIMGTDIPIAGIAGDQQAALFGQRCFNKGDTKNTYGTGCFLLMNTGNEVISSKSGLITTVAATPKGVPVQYALEGSVFIAGAVIQWLRDELGLIKSAADSQRLAETVDDTAGVYMVPAFTGLGAPYWDMYARGVMVGLTRGTGVAHIVRASLESIAFQSNAVIEAMEQDVNYHITSIKVDGGASANDFLMQFQSDISDLFIERPEIMETTALGAAYLAALAVGYTKNLDELSGIKSNSSIFTPNMKEKERNKKLVNYNRTVERAKGWEL